MKKYSLTFDIDWAPDFAIRYCLDLLDSAKVVATFFATHNSSINTEIVSRGHTLGIHPNFLQNSSHGSNVQSVIEKCLTYVPNAWCMRTHSLVQSSPILYEVFSKFPQLKLDVSLFMHRSPYSHKCNWEMDGVVFERLLYNWEDDAEFHQQRFSNNDNLFFGDLTVCDFHPIHVFLNSSNGSEYSNLKKEIRGKPLFELKEDITTPYRNLGIGVDTHLQSLLSSNAISLRLDEI